MKKYFAILLTFVMLLSLFSCNLAGDITAGFGKFTTPEETTTEPQQIPIDQNKAEGTTEQNSADITTPEETTPEEPKELTPPQLDGYPIAPPELKKDIFGSYEEILDIYRLAIERFDLVEDSTEMIAHTLGFASVEQVEWFEAILMSSYLHYRNGSDSDDARNATWDRLYYFTYVETDLNNDRNDELILLTLTQDVLAIFSQTDKGEPVLLGNYTPRKVCEIGANGKLYVTEEEARTSYSKRVYEIADGGKGLNKIIEYGVDDLLFSRPGFYRERNGKKVGISNTAFELLEKDYGIYETVWYATRPLFSSTRILRAMYQPAINGEVPIYLVETGEYIYLEDYTPPHSTTPLSKRGELKCSFGNFDADQTKMLECVIHYGDLLLLEYDYITDTVSARSLTDKEKLIAKGGIYYPLAAPWREVNITAQEIKVSVPGYWDTYDGFVQTIGKTNVTDRISVSPLPDENEYYLVTWSREYAPAGCTCTDCDAGIPHATEPYKYLLIHAKTGEIIEIAVIPQAAKEAAAKYWNTYDGFVDHAAGSTYVTRIVIEGKPEYDFGGMYYHVIWQIEHYSHEGYENGEEPHSVYDYKHLYVHTQTGECYMYPFYDAK